MIEELKQFIIDALVLEHWNKDEIDENAELFSDEFGLDSIDVLELMQAVRVKYKVEFPDHTKEVVAILYSVNTLATYIQSHQ